MSKFKVGDIIKKRVNGLKFEVSKITNYCYILIPVGRFKNSPFTVTQSTVERLFELTYSQTSTELNKFKVGDKVKIVHMMSDNYGLVDTIRAIQDVKIDDYNIILDNIAEQFNKTELERVKKPVNTCNCNMIGKVVTFLNTDNDLVAALIVGITTINDNTDLITPDNDYINIDEIIDIYEKK